MDIKRMKKSELVELNGQLNESRIHCDAVIDALRAELAAARAEIEALRAQAESPVATGSAQAHSVSQRVVRNNKLIHEFDPEVQGSYLAAMRRARDLGGVVRRAQP
jgi:predicted  nucleic acid-binding Zn-ribbon protein